MTREEELHEIASEVIGDISILTHSDMSALMSAIKREEERRATIASATSEAVKIASRYIKAGGNKVDLTNAITALPEE